MRRLEGGLNLFSWISDNAFSFKISRLGMAFCHFWATIERRIGRGRTLFLEGVELWVWIGLGWDEIGLHGLIGGH